MIGPTIYALPWFWQNWQCSGCNDTYQMVGCHGTWIGGGPEIHYIYIYIVDTK